MTKQFRIKVTLEGDTAEAFAKVERKAHVVAAALDQYFGLGSAFQAVESRLRAIQEQLNRGPVPAPVKANVDGDDEDDTDEKIDALIGKTLRI